MSLSARPSVYKVGRVTSLTGLIVGLMSLCPALVHAQAAETPPAPPAEPAATPVAAPPPAISPEVAARLDEIDQRSRIVERKLELAQEAAAQKAPSPTVSADEKGFGISSSDKAFELKIHALLQIDGRRIFGSDDAALRDRVDTFLVRRARPILEATVLGLVDLRITPDFGNNTTALYDAYADVHPTPWLRLRAGKFKPPIGLERLQADQYVPFIERGLDSNLSAQRDIGVQLWGDVANAALHYDISIFNGVPDGTLTDLDDEHAKTYAGRLFLRPFQLGDLREFGDLGFGAAVESGNEKGSTVITAGAASNTWLPTFKSAAQQTIFTYASSGTDPTLTVFSNGRHTRVNPQLYYYVGPFGLLAEWVYERQGVTKGGVNGEITNQAGHVAASFVIGGDETYDGPKVKKVANWATKDLGALEIAGRFGWLHVGDNAPVYADLSKSVTEGKAWSVAVNWWLNRNVRVGGAYEYTTFTDGAGTSKVLANRAAEKAGFARLQVSF
jgi:phosphate-selective porin OprO/OprP